MTAPRQAGVPVELPTLTEVVELAPVVPRFDEDERAEAPRPEAGGPRAAPLPTDEQLVRRVMAELERQIDVMLEYRIREVLTPLLARAADNLVRDARTQLASTLRDVVARAVAGELAGQWARQSER